MEERDGERRGERDGGRRGVRWRRGRCKNKRREMGMRDGHFVSIIMLHSRLIKPV